MTDVDARPQQASGQDTGEYAYQRGFGNEFATEAVAGALPAGRNSPQRAPLGLYAEQLSGTAFTAPRADNRRTWLYRIRPSAAHPSVRPHRQRHPARHPVRRDRARPEPAALEPAAACPTPHRLRRRACSPWPATATCGRADGMAVHVYAANRSMTDRYFYDADGELLIVPQRGALALRTELGPLAVAPGEIAVIPRGIRFRVELRAIRRQGAAATSARTTAPRSRLPDLRPDRRQRPGQRARLPGARRGVRGPGRRPCRWCRSSAATCGRADYDHSPLDVVAWHGNYAPYKYDLRRFNAIGTISFDHPDPSIFTVLTSPERHAGPRQRGLRDLPAALAGRRGHLPAALVPPQRDERVHGPGPRRLRRQGRRLRARRREPAQHAWPRTARTPRPSQRASTAELRPQKIDDTLAFMFESRWMLVPTRQAMEAAHRQHDYDAVWAGLTRSFRG